MIIQPFDPVAFSLGPIQVHWYGCMYLLGFLAAWRLCLARAPRYGLSSAQVSDFITWLMLGVLAGGRIGYVLFYELSVFLANPLEILCLWHGGMSFHGGCCGVLTAAWIWAKRQKRSFWSMMDFIVPTAPPGLFLGRIGNFINGELWGAETTLPWGMATAPDMPLRHPSQLYEAGLEGLLLFIILWLYSSKPRPEGHVSGLFALLYAVFRCLVEFVRKPDPQLGYLAWGWLTMGQMLCLPMIALGCWLLCRKPSGGNEA